MSDGLPLQPQPLDRTRPEPLWHQLAEAIRTKIAAGEWPPGHKIPPEDQLCDSFAVSRITVRHAVQTLETEGLLRRDQGRGTFVRDARLVAGATGLTNFTDEVARLGIRAGSRLLDVTRGPATAEVAAALGIDEGAEVHRIRRLRLGDGAPMGIQTAHLPVARLPDLALRDDDASLYAVLRDRHGIVPTEAAEVYRVTAAGEDDARILEIEPGSPVFIVERTTVDVHGPFEFVVSTMRGDRYEIRTVLRAF